MKKTTQAALARPLADAIFAKEVGVEAEYMALAPHIPAPRHVLPPSILGNQTVIHPRNRSSGLFGRSAGEDGWLISRIYGGNAIHFTLSQKTSARSKKLGPFRGRLSADEIAHGMNIANANAQRLAEDAQTLISVGRIPTAASLAALSIEESGKASVLQQLATATLRCK